MSNKKRKINEANLLSEHRYLKNKFIFEDMVTSAETPTNTTTDETQTSKDFTDLGVNVTDLTTQQSILKQLEPYKNKINITSLQQNVGKPTFFDVLGNYMKFDLEKDSKYERGLSPSQSKTATGEEATIKLGNLTLKGTFDFNDNQVGDLGLGYKTKIAHQPVTLTAKVKNPSSLIQGNVNTDNFNVGVKTNIGGGNNKKNSGYKL